MGGTTADFIVAGTASDADAGLFSIDDNTAFGNNLSRGGSLASWTFTYEIDSGDAGNGTFVISYTAIDNVGNTNTTTFEFHEDNEAPSVMTPDGTFSKASQSEPEAVRKPSNPAT